MEGIQVFFPGFACSGFTTMTLSTQGNAAASSFCRPSTRAIRVTCQRQQKPVGAILTVPPSTPAKITSPVRDLNRSAFFAMIIFILSMSACFKIPPEKSES